MNPLAAYLRDVLALHKKILLWPINKMERSNNIKMVLKARNFKLMLQGNDIRFYFSESKKLFFVREKDRTHYFANLKRGFGLYSNGINHRAEKLWESYLLDKVEFKQEDTVVDCGANYADLWLVLKEKINPDNYITFEPGIGEFASIRENSPTSKNNNVGLSNVNGKAAFYVNDRDADSSIIEPSSYSDVIEVETVTLDSYLDSKAIKTIKLLKLEAEGFEPEILEGAKSVLCRVDYIAIDGGYERGVKKEETFSYQTNLLLDNGFQMLGVNLVWGRALFKRKRVN